MPATFTEDLVIGAERVVDVNGVTRKRVFYAEGLTPTGDVLLEASQLINIAYGQPHNSEPNLYAANISQLPWRNSRTQAKQTVIYRTPDFSNAVTPRISFCGTSREVVTNFDYQHKKILVKYTDSDGNDSTQIGQVSSLKAWGLLEIERTEPELPSFALTAIRKMNSSGFQGQPKFTWLMRNVEFREVLYQPGFRVKYTIEYDEETHLKIAAFRNIFGVVPEDIDDIDLGATDGNGWTRTQDLPVFNFDGLDLPVVFGDDSPPCHSLPTFRQFKGSDDHR
jgi:hypothetical protein